MNPRFDGDQRGLALPPLANPHFLDITSRAVFDPDECDSVIKHTDPDAWHYAQIEGYGTERPGGVQLDERSVTQQPLPVDADGWPLTELLRTLEDINEEIYRFEVDRLPPSDYPNVLRYEASGADHFRPHSDTGPSYTTRKLSYTLQLSPPDTYVGGDLLFSERAFQASRAQGELTVFPSFLRHTVTPVISGERLVIVGWVHGPTFR